MFFTSCEWSAVAHAMGIQETAEESVEITERTEIPEERTAYSTSWRLPDGKKEVVYHTGAVRFENENGELTDYDSSLYEIGEEDIQTNGELSGYSYGNSAGEKKQYFPQDLSEDTPLRIENGIYQFSVAPFQEKGAEDSDSNWKALKEAAAEDSEVVDLYGEAAEKTTTAVYEAQDGSFAQKYTSYINGVKGEFVLYDQPDSNSWIYVLQLSGGDIYARKQENSGGIQIFTKEEEGNEKVIGGIQVPSMNDASGERYSKAVSYTLKEDPETPGRYLLLIILDAEYLASPDVQYPVTVCSSYAWAADQGVGEVSVTSGSMDGNIDENTSEAAETDENSAASDAAETEDPETGSSVNTVADTNFCSLGAGYFCVGTNEQGISRTYLSSFSGIQSTDDQPDQFLLNLVETENSQAGGTVEVYQAAESWDPSLITWNNQPGIMGDYHGSGTTIGEAGHVVSIDLTDYFQNQSEEGRNNGLVLKGADETENGQFMQFYSSQCAGTASYMPSLSVIYEGEPASEETSDPDETAESEEPTETEEDPTPSERTGEETEESSSEDTDDTEQEGPSDSDVTYDESADIVGELKELRDENSKQFLLSDGTVSLVQYDTDVHYQNEAGDWREINNSLSSESAEDSSDTSGFSTKEGRVKFKFAKNVNASFLVRMMQGNYHLFFSLQNSQKKSDGAKILKETRKARSGGSSLADQVEVDNIHNGVIYEEILPGTDLEYITSGSSLKENIIVKEKQDAYQYTFEVKTNKLDIHQEKDGIISFLAQDTGKLMYSLPAMYMVDAEGAESDAVDFQITTKNKKSTLTITADAEWINAEDRVFPVVIDPTLEASSSSTGDESRIVRNQYVASGRPTTSSAGYGRGYLGYDGSGDKIYRLFVQFKTLPKIPASSVIASAKFYYAQAGYDHVGMSQLIIAAKEVTEDWTWGTRLNWNTQPSFSSTILDYQILSSSTNGEYVGWDITKLIKNHYENKDNTSNATSSFVLTGTDESSYAYNHLAKADVIQENSAGYFSSAQPVLVIAYRDTQGLEDYYTYQTQSVGKAGTAYIGDYTKQLTLERTNFATNSTAIPFQISHIYNSSFGDQYFSSSSNNTKNFNNMKIGMGWKLNIQEMIIEKTISGKKYLVYNDSDGTDHYMPLDSGSTYKDEDGLKLTVTKAASPVKYTMKDEKGNQKIFYNGFLSSILDANGNAIHLLYNGAEYSAGGTWYADTGSTNRITKVVQVNKGQSTPKTIATLDYADTTFLHSITDSAGRTWQYKFTRGADADGNPSGYNLTKIVDPDGTYARYDYYLISTHKVNKLSRTYDSETLLGGRYTYSVTKQSCRMNSFGEIHWTSDTEYQKDQTVAITNTDPLQVYYQDYGLDCKAGTADDIWTYVTFDNAGRTISEASMDDSRQVYYGASSTAYTGTGSTSNAHKVLSDVVTGVNGINLLKNGSAEILSGSKATGWEAHRNVSSSTVDKMTMSYDTTGAIRTGSRNFHVTTETGAQPNSSGLLRATFSTTAALTAGKTYTFSGYFSNTDTANFNDKSQAYLKVNNSSGTQMAIGSVVDECTSAGIEDGWARLSVTFTPSSSGTYTFAACTDWIYGSSSFDDFQLEEGEAASRYNYLANGDLEWADGWSYSGASREQGSIHGSYNIRIPGDPLKKNIASITVPLKISSNNNFVLSGWAKADSAADIDKEKSSERAFGLEAVLTYSDSTTETHYVSFDGSTSHLQFASGNIVPKKADQTLSSIQIRCVYGKNVNTAYFDNICLRKEPVECYKYDSEGNVTAVNTTGNDQLTFAYSAGNLIKEQSKGEGTYHYTYDSKHNLTKATNDGVDMVLTYDTMGHVKTSKVQNTSSDSNKSISTSATYTSDGDYLATQTDATGAKTTYTTNSYGLTASVTDALSHKTAYGYNTKNNRMTSVTLDDGTAVNYTYTNGMISSMVRNSLLPDGSTKVSQSYTYTYDLYDNVTAVKVGSKTLASYTYMAKNGPLTKVTYGNGNTVEYTHDALGRVITEKQNGTLKYRYVYGSEGDLSRLEEVNSSGKVMKATCYEYDSLDRLIRSWEEVLEGNALVKDVSTQHLYDTSNRLKQQSWQTSDGTTRSETYTYNSKDGTLTKMKTASGRTITLSYDYLKRLQSKTDGVRTVAYTYKDVGTSGTSTQVAGMAWTGLGDNNLAFGYTYDKLGNITKVTSNSATSAQYTYDVQSQLVTEKLPQSSLEYTYSYDTGGNIRSIVTKNNGTQTTRTFSYTDSNWKDLLTAVDGHSLTYDAGGNPLTYYNGADWSFTWKNGRELATAVSGNTSVSYTYDSDGIRTSKTVNGVTHNYVYLGDLLVEETWGSNKLQFAYDDQNKPYSVKYNDNLYYYVLNQQGDVIRLVNGDGVIRAEYTYNAWGELVGITNGGAIATVNPLRYRGYVYDDETGFYYVSSRYYDPVNCRFISADDMEVLQGKLETVQECNLFSYCFNNPVTLTDSTGEWPSWAKKVAIGTAVIAATAVLTVATAGTGTALACVASGALKGAVSGALIGAATGGAQGAVSHRISTGSWKGAKKAALKGAASGYMSGAISGAISGGMTSKVCFIEGTAILTAAGHTAIERIRAGDLVWSENPETGEKALKKVVQTFENQTLELVRIHAGNETVTATPKHPFYVFGKGWTSAIELRAGDILEVVNGEYVVVEFIQHEILEKPIKVYNFEVADFHTYFVGDSNVLVHNACGPKHKKVFNTRKQAFKAAKRDLGIPRSQQPIRVTRAINKQGKRIPGRDYYFSGNKVIRNHTAGHFDFGRHFNATVNRINMHYFY